MDTVGKLGWGLFVIAALVAAYYMRDASTANARAEAQRQTWEATAAAYRAEIATRDSAIASRAARIQELEARQTVVVAAADSVAVSRPAEPAREGFVSDSVWGIWQAWRTSVLTELALLRHALDLQAQVVADLKASLDDRTEQLRHAQARLATAEAGWQASERARQPTLITHATRVLALVGGIVIADRLGCAATGKALLLACGT